MTEKKKKEKEEYNQKTAKMTEEEWLIRQENLEARKCLQDDSIKTLYSAACLAAVKDYRRYIRKLRQCNQLLQVYKFQKKNDFLMTLKDRHQLAKRIKNAEKSIEELKENIEECEDFFDSDIFATCTGVVDKDEVIRKIKAIPDGYDHVLERGFV